MDSHMKRLLERAHSAAQTVGYVTESAARTAGRLAGTAVDLSKLNLQLRELNADIATLLRDAGQIIYDAHLGLDTNDAMLAQILEQLDVKNAQVMELRTRIEAAKSGRRCPSCGAACPAQELFCPQCGALLQ